MCLMINGVDWTLHGLMLDIICYGNTLCVSCNINSVLVSLLVYNLLWIIYICTGV